MSPIRSSYTLHACSQCRTRKRKCDGVEPICGFCKHRGDECVWSPQPFKPLSKYLLESLRNRIVILEKDNDLLRADLAQCSCRPTRHGAQSVQHETPTGSNEDHSDATLHHTNWSDDIEELCAPTKNLVLECDELRMYSPTSAFRMNPKPCCLKLRNTVARHGVQAQNNLTNGTYVLYANDNVDWSHYLPVTTLTRAEHDRLLDILFKFQLTWCVRIVSELFFSDMYQALSSPTSVETEHYSPMLHNALVALACSFSDDPVIRDLQTQRAFLNQAKRYMDGECKNPNISTIQGLDIMGSCHSSMAEHTLGYMYFGMSGRTSQALGLNADCSSFVTSGLISRQVMIQRSWAYWTLYTTDVYWALFVGDCCLPDPASAMEKVSLPPIDKDIDSAAWDQSVPLNKVRDQPSRILTVFVASCELMMIGRKIIDLVNSGMRQKDTYKRVTEIDLELHAWKNNLSSQVDISPASRGTALPHRLVLHMTYWWLLSLIHRPFYYRHLWFKSELNHTKLCNRAAYNILSLLSTYDRLYGLRYSSTPLIQITFSAGTVFLLSAVRALSGTRVSKKVFLDSMTQADICLQYLGKIAISYRSSGVIKGILENMTRAWIAPRMGARFKEVGIPDGVGEDGIEVSALGTKRNSNVMKAGKQHILNSSKSQESFAYQQSMDAGYALFSTGTYLPSCEKLPNKPFMAFNCSTGPKPMQRHLEFDPGDYPADLDALVADTGMSAQELIDDLRRYWR